MTPRMAALDSSTRLVRCAHCGLELARIEVSPAFADADGIVTESRWPIQRVQIVFDSRWLRTKNGRWRCLDQRDIAPPSGRRRISPAPRPARRARISRMLSSISDEAVHLQLWRSRSVEAECPRCSGVSRISERDST